MTLADGSAVRVQVEGADVEDAFEAFRLEAFVDPSPEGVAEAAGDFAAGGNDVVLFTGATWSESGAARIVPGIVESPITPDSVVHFSGHPGQLPESAEIVCITTDAIVIATGQGTGVLIRTGLKPYSLDVIRDAEVIATFLRERSYTTGEEEAGE